MIINSFRHVLSGFCHFFKFQMKNMNCRWSWWKYAKMAFFGQKTYFKKFFWGYFYPPALPMQKNWAKKAFKLVFIGAGIKSPFQRPLLVGLMKVLPLFHIQLQKLGLLNKVCVRMLSLSVFLEVFRKGQFWIQEYNHHSTLNSRSPEPCRTLTLATEPNSQNWI